MARVAVHVAGGWLSVDPVPTGALYSILVVTHVLCAVAGFGAIVLTGVQAGRARRGPTAPGADSVRRYFRPGVNWVGRLVYGVPVLGYASIETSNGAWHAGDGFVVAGLVLWLASAVLAELVAWPGERRIQTIVTGGWDDPRSGRELDRQCRRVSAVAAVVAGLFVVAVVVMVARP